MIRVTNSIALRFDAIVFSPTKAGIGSAPIAAAAAQNDSPAKQGLISMLGTIIDTLIICTMTGLTIVITDSWNVGLDGVDVTTRAFQQGLPFNSSIASFILMVCLVFFAFTTILGWDYYSASLAMGHKVHAAPGWSTERLLCLELCNGRYP